MPASTSLSRLLENIQISWLKRRKHLYYSARYRTAITAGWYSFEKRSSFFIYCSLFPFHYYSLSLLIRFMCPAATINLFTEIFEKLSTFRHSVETKKINNRQWRREHNWRKKRRTSCCGVATKNACIENTPKRASQSKRERKNSLFRFPEKFFFFLRLRNQFHF